jgi:N utilization substance protein A
VPAFAHGELEIVSIARYPGVLSKVAVRRRPRIKLSGRPVGLVLGVGADYVNRVSAQLGGERLHVLHWHGNPAGYISEVLGIGYRWRSSCRPQAE